MQHQRPAPRDDTHAASDGVVVPAASTRLVMALTAYSIVSLTANFKGFRTTGWKLQAAAGFNIAAASSTMVAKHFANMFFVFFCRRHACSDTTIQEVVCTENCAGDVPAIKISRSTKKIREETWRFAVVFFEAAAFRPLAPPAGVGSSSRRVKTFPRRPLLGLSLGGRCDRSTETPGGCARALVLRIIADRPLLAGVVPPHREISIFRPTGTTTTLGSRRIPASA